MAEKKLLQTRLREGLNACRLSGGHVLLAISGGADSVAMLRGMLSLRDEMHLRLTVAHLNHQLRGNASADDARWVEALSGQLGLPCILASESVPEIAGRRGRGLEETARHVRYEFLERTAREQGCSHIATAHTADDQAETILHNVLRGTGMAGLAGMPRIRPVDGGLLLVRPLLDISRAEIEAYLQQIGQEHRQDETNLNEAFTRNRIRRVLLPLLRSEFNPRVDDALRRLGRQAAEVRDAMARLTAQLLDDAVLQRSPAVCRFDLQVLQRQPRHVIRECFAQLWKEQSWPRQGLGFDDWDRLASLVQGERDGSLTLSGPVEAIRRGHLLMLRCR